MNEQATYAFIGGSQDGKRHSVTLENVRFVVADGTRYDYEEYRSFRIAGEVEQFVVYALAEMSPDDVLRKLIAGYEA